MGLFDKLREPIVLKDDSDAKKQLEQLEFYSKVAPENTKNEILQDMKNINAGIYGENALMYELKNSHMPMYILHDVFFEDNGLTTQIDFIVVTRKLTIIIECKNLYGNITVDNQGGFTRTVKYGNRYHKEGIYSPLTQNQRHLDMIKEKRRATKNMLIKGFFDKAFDDNYKSVVVLANPKTVLDMKYAPKEIKNKIVRLDGLTAYIKKLNEESRNPTSSDKEMKAMADFFLVNSVVNTADYTEKYRSIVENFISTMNTEPAKESEKSLEYTKQMETQGSNKDFEIIENSPVYKALREYRYKQSQKEKIKPYFIYNNAQLEDIIRHNPKTLDELKQLNGFGDVKCMKYGKDILMILGDYR